MSVGIGKGDGAIFATVGKEFFPIGPTGRGHLSVPMKGATVGTLDVHAAKLEGTPFGFTCPRSQRRRSVRHVPSAISAFQTAGEMVARRQRKAASITLGETLWGRNSRKRTDWHDGKSMKGTWLGPRLGTKTTACSASCISRRCNSK